MKELKGLVPPMITVWRNDESFDEEGMRKHVNFLIERGVQGLVPCGSTGEFISMTLEERKKVAEVVVDAAKKRVPVYVHTGCFRTKTTIELSKHAEAVGADGVMVIAPYYLKPQEREVKEHFRALAREINIPIMAYNNVRFAGTELSMPSIVELHREGVLSSVKLAHGDAARVHDLKQRLGDDQMTILYGHNTSAFQALAAGADGWVAGIGNLAPEVVRKMCDLILERNDLRKAREYWYKIIPLIRCSSTPKRGLPTPDWLQTIKEGLKMRGRDVGPCRKPTLPLEEEDREQLRKVLGQLNLLAEVPVS